MLISLGAIGVGLVLGWLLGSFAGQPRRTPLSIVSLSGGSLASAAVVAWVAGKSGLPSFAVATLVTLFLHSQWRVELRKRYRNSS